MKDNNISVILITYFTGEVLFDSIKSCLNMEGVREIIVLNNGNPKNVTESLIKLDSDRKITLINGHGNIGFARACNIGAMYSKGEYLMFINPDCYTDDKNFATKLRNAIKSDQKYWFATSLILNSNGTIQRTCRRNIMNLTNAISQSLGFHKFGIEKIDRDESEIASLPEISELEAFSGALFFCSKGKYYEIGCMSEDYFLHVEDMDLCKKIQEAGGKICFVKNAVIYHKLSTSNVTNKFLEWHKARGFIHYLNKFYPWTNHRIINKILRAAIWARYYFKIRKVS
jgi:N-acetylglucosaminyl-diphospho-decaprenol L-rhamnosyltransferase